MGNRRKNGSVMWNYFDKLPNQKSATCRVCSNDYSFYSTTGNLRMHLKRVHPDVYKRINWGCKLANEEEESEELLKLSDVWSYYAVEGRQARCVVCKETVANEYDEVKAHLKEEHPDVLLQIMQDKEQSDAASNNADDDNDNTYTEVVYLEQDSLSENIVKHKKPKTYPKAAIKRFDSDVFVSKKRESRHDSDEFVSNKREKRHDSDEFVPKRPKVDDTDELGSFVKYITCLLKKLPADVFSNIQVDIINTILTANSQAKSVSKNQVPASPTSNSVTVNEITHGVVSGHNYTITLAPQEGASENS